MLIRILPSNMMAAQPEYVAQPHFVPGEILINGTCVRAPPRRLLRKRPACARVSASTTLASPELARGRPYLARRACTFRTRCRAGIP